MELDVTNALLHTMKQGVPEYQINAEFLRAMPHECELEAQNLVSKPGVTRADIETVIESARRPTKGAAK